MDVLEFLNFGLKPVAQQAINMETMISKSPQPLKVFFSAQGYLNRQKFNLGLKQEVEISSVVLKSHFTKKPLILILRTQLK